MARLLLIILLIVVGSKVIYKDNFAILEGTLTTPESGSETLSVQRDVNYPNDFNADNCVVISYLAKRNDDFGWATYTPKDAAGYLIGSAGLRVLLKSNNITIAKDKSDSSEPSTTVNYKIILMKIN